MTDKEWREMEQMMKGVAKAQAIGDRMKLLHLEIRNCRECPHFIVMPTLYVPYCRNMLHTMSALEVSEVGDGIPDWCPLPDAKEEK